MSQSPNEKIYNPKGANAAAPIRRTSRNEHENKFEELTGLRIEDVYSPRTYNPKNRHVGLRNGLIFHVNRLTKDKILAEEIADDVLERVIFHKLDTYDPTLANFPTWLFQIGKHEAMAYRTKQRIKVKLSEDEEFQSIEFIQKYVSIDDEDNRIMLVNSLETNDEEALSVSERDETLAMKHEVVKKAIFSLDDKKSSALAMRLLDGLQYKDITEFTGENLNTIKSRIKQGKAAVIRKTKRDLKLIEQYME